MTFIQGRVDLSVTEKLRILADAAKFDVACTSSGVGRGNSGHGIGNCIEAGICHSFAADGRCISLLKVLFTNECIFDCRYCLNRRSNDVPRAAFTPDEVCELTMEFYRRNYIEGLFLSSGIVKSPDYTMELLYETLLKLRKQFRFGGYIHVKAIPGADPALIERTGFLADRMSVNLELPTAEGLRTLAPAKTREKILTPMRQIQNGRLEYGERLLGGSGTQRGYGNGDGGEEMRLPRTAGQRTEMAMRRSRGALFVPAGQSTQMIIGATPENDFQIMSVAESLYQRFDLKRVFYSAFVRVNEDKLLPDLPGGPPLLREHRLYQADWLLRFYGFEAGELLSEERPNFNVLLDPKCDWALRHLECFPVEVNRASYQTLLRVPGIGVKSAQRIVKARKLGTVDFPDLKRMGVVLKRALYFITCRGKTLYPIRIEEDFITRNILDVKERLPYGISGDVTYRQLSLFDDFQVDAGAAVEPKRSLVV